MNEKFIFVNTAVRINGIIFSMSAVSTITVETLARDYTKPYVLRVTFIDGSECDAASFKDELDAIEAFNNVWTTGDNCP